MANVGPQPSRAKGEHDVQQALCFYDCDALCSERGSCPGHPACHTRRTSCARTCDDGSGTPWLWIIIGLAIVAGLVWYFMRGRSRATSAGTTGPSSTPGTATSQPKVFDNDKRK